MKKRTMRAPVSVGLCTCVTVLMVLCLTVFAALALSSARADYALSKIGADTVSAFYRADAQAAVLYHAFAAGTQTELIKTLPISENQSLYLHLRRSTSGAVETIAWQTVSVQPEAAENQPIPVWTGKP